jgi:predicted enzyme related to lactoylglutathione lyase
MAIKRISLSWVGVSDFAKAKDFFVNTLGLKVFEVHEQYGWMELQGKEGSQVLGIGAATSESEMKAGINAVVTFVTDDYEKTKTELTQKGINLFGEVTGYPDVPRMICFKDPDGNTFQLVEETPGHTGNF